MTTEDYQRVQTPPDGAQNAGGHSGGGDDAGAAALSAPQRTIHIRWALLPLSMLLCAAQAALTVMATHTAEQVLTSTLITVIGFGLVFLLVLLFNPLLRLLCGGRTAWLLNRAELASLLAAMTVTAGVATFGLADQLIPLIAAPYNASWNTPQRGWDKRLHRHLNDQLYITDPQVIEDFRNGVTDQPIATAPTGEWLRFYWRVLGEIPWDAWLKPLAAWLVFIFGCYGIFYGLAGTVIEYWSRREKLIFPLAKLADALLPEEPQTHWLPALFRSPLFWLGVAVSATVLMYNAAAVANWIPLPRIGLGMSEYTVDALVRDTFFAGLGGKNCMAFLIIFTAIGLAFLLPLEISFSIWFYYLLGQGLILTLCRLGYGVNGNDFPTEWTTVHNPVTAQGSGAMLLFSAVSLYRALREYFRLGRSLTGWARLRVMLPVVVLAASMAVVTLWTAWNRIPLHWALLFTCFLTLLTLGLMRIVAEGGIYWFQAHTSFFHFYTMTGLGKVMAPIFAGPLLLIYSVLFLDVKTFLAPNLVNAARMQQESSAPRFRFHLNIVLSTLTAVAVALVHSLLLAYAQGANRMQSWFYTSAPRSFIDKAASLTTQLPSFNGATFAWFTVGAVWVVLTMHLRSTLFWFPHPIGYIMLINPLMSSLWFSFFIGWVIKKIVVRYGGKASFDRVRQVMLGLVMGELLVIFLCAVLALSLRGVSFPGIDLNRYGP